MGAGRPPRPHGRKESGSVADSAVEGETWSWTAVAVPLPGPCCDQVSATPADCSPGTERKHRAFERFSLSASGADPVSGGHSGASAPGGARGRGAPERSSWRGDLLAAVQAGALPGGRGPWGLLALRPRPAVCTGHGVAGAPQAGLGSEAPGRGAAAVWAAACVRSPRRVGWRAGSVAGGGFAARLVKGQGTAP